jgi:hypothetical protein
MSVTSKKRAVCTAGNDLFSTSKNFIETEMATLQNDYEEVVVGGDISNLVVILECLQKDGIASKIPRSKVNLKKGNIG